MHLSTCAKIVTLALAQLPGPVLSIYLYLINVLLYILYVKLNYNDREPVLCFYSDRHFTRDYCYLRLSLEKWTRKAGNEAETNHVPHETGNLDAGLRRVTTNLVCARAYMRLFVCNTARDIGEIFFYVP